MLQAITLQFPGMLSKCLGLLVMIVGCQNPPGGPVRKGKNPENPAAPAPSGSPFGQFSPEQVYSALRKTFFKARRVDSARLGDSEKCEISEGTQVVLKTPPQAPVDKHWSIELQMKIPGCGLERGYLFAEHWQSAQPGGGSGKNFCGFPADLDYERGKQLAQEINRINIGRFTGRCYEYAGIAIENIGLMPKGPAAWRAAGVPVESAADFVFVEQSAVADRFVRLRPQNWGCLPVGTIVVWNRSVCGFNATHGHIEIVTIQNESNPTATKLCSDGCQTLQTKCSVTSGVSFFYPRKKF